jgi:tRNA threonylcarbamoyladenosine modification (KEOPS) complex  Pcc1 subunit
LELKFESGMVQCIGSLRRTENVRLADLRGFLGLLLVYGTAQNVTLKWPQGPMILAHRQYRAEIRFSFQKFNKRSRLVAEAAFSALHPDTKYFSKDNSSMSNIFLNDYMIIVQVEANDIASLRANLNSYFRLFRLCVLTLSDS